MESSLKSRAGYNGARTAVFNVKNEKKTTLFVVFMYVINEKFCQLCLYIQAYPFIRDLRGMQNQEENKMVFVH